MLIIRVFHSQVRQRAFSAHEESRIREERASSAHVKIGASYSLAAGLVLCASGPWNW